MGANLVKRVIHAVVVDAASRVVTSRQLPREKLLSWCAQRPAGCTVTVETCSGAHHWASKRAALGLRPQLIAGDLVPQSPEALRGELGDVIEDASNEWPGIARLALKRPFQHGVEVDGPCGHVTWCDERMAEPVRCDEWAHTAREVSGVDPITASAMVASVELGLVPKQNSTGGKTNLGNITKRGDEYLRTQLIQGAKSADTTAHQRSDRISQWVDQLKARVG
uniref:transposase n=1 Tax=Leptothrix discophora TaxID=89 RepID=UPI0034E52942